MGPDHTTYSSAGQCESATREQVTVKVGANTLAQRDYTVTGVVTKYKQSIQDLIVSTDVVKIVYAPNGTTSWSSIQDFAGNDAEFVRIDCQCHCNCCIVTYSSAVNEDVATNLNTGSLVFSDFDSSSIKVKLESSAGRIISPSSFTGVTVTGSDTGALILSGAAADINAAMATNSIQYVTSPNGVTAGTIAVYVSDDAGTTYTQVTTSSVVVAGKNDSIVLDLDTDATSPSKAGYGYTALFRPRGDAVPIVSSSATIADPDGTQITRAVIRISGGDVDNQFGTMYETLTSTLNSAATFTRDGVVANGLTVTGNGTTQIEITGLGTHANYMSLLQSIQYLNANTNAYGGDRQISIRLTDKYGVESEQQESNKALLTLATANSSVKVGQKIWIGALDGSNVVYSDSGATVSAVSGEYLSASNNLPLLSDSSFLKFETTGSVANTLALTNGSGATVNLGIANSAVGVGQDVYAGGTGSVL
jgi:hypothetical protein